MLLVYAVVLGLAAGFLSRGRASALGSVHIRFWPVALCGLLFQALLFSSPLAQNVGSLGPSLYVVSTALVLMTLIVNVRQPGFWLIAVGASLNFVAIVANNGYMPASPDALASLTGAAAIPTADYTNSALTSGSTALSFLGDIFVLPRPVPLANIFSIGDVLIGGGGVWFLVRAMHSGNSTPVPVAVGRSRHVRSNHA